MSEIKLEVGQVWKSRGFIFDILKLWDGKVEYYAHSSNGVNTYSELAFLSDGLKLITNADGTPHTPANDYQAGDVWEGTFNETIIQYFIYLHNLTLCYICGSGASGPLSMVNNFVTNPQDYKLIHREEE